MIVVEEGEADATGARMRKLVRLPSVPRPLALLLVVVAVFTCFWALLTPAWGGPDEDVHFAYTQTLSERHELPGNGAGPVSTEQKFAADYSELDTWEIFEYAKPEWAPTKERTWKQLAGTASRTDGGGNNTASRYPAAYYLAEALPYSVASSGTIFTRLYAMRLFSGIWLLVGTVAAWLLAGEVFGRRRPLQLVTAAAVGLLPMTSFISTVINPDAMLVALYTLVLWLGAAILKRGLTFGRAAALCACVGVALVTKATALALLPPALFVIAVSAWPLRRRLALRSLAPAAAAFALLAIPVVAWYVAADANGQSAFFQADVVTSSAPSGGTTTAAGGGVSVASSGAPPSRGFTVNEFGSYLWQFYLPKLPFLHEVKNMIPTISHYPVFQTWLASSWANFGWANVWFPKDVYFGFLLIVVVAVLAAAWPRLRAWRPRRRLPRLGPNATVGAFFAVTGLTLLAGLHWTDFHMYLTHGGPFLQGRYLLPLGALFALVLAAATQAAPRRFRGAAAGAVLAGLTVFQIACLGLIFARYYA